MKTALRIVAGLLAVALVSFAQPTLSPRGDPDVFEEAISRSFTVFNQNPEPIDETISRAFTVFNQNPEPVDETISRAFTACNTAGLGDADGNGTVDELDFANFELCFTGLDCDTGDVACLVFDFDCDGDIDCTDWSAFVEAWTEERDPPEFPDCPIVFEEAVSRAFTVFNQNPEPMDETISRAFTVFNQNPEPVDETISRASTVFNQNPEPVDETISRAFTACNTSGLGDADGKGTVDHEDFKAFELCFTGLDCATGDVTCFVFDFDCDLDVDCTDWLAFVEAWTDKDNPPPSFSDCPGCEADANDDHTVDPLDAGFVLARFGCPVGTCDPSCDIADMNGDGFVDPLDVGFVLARFGPCP